MKITFFFGPDSSSNRTFFLTGLSFKDVELLVSLTSLMQQEGLVGEIFEAADIFVSEFESLVLFSSIFLTITLE